MIPTGNKQPKQRPGRSKQDYGTPPEFIVAVEERFRRITFDLAADRDNAVVPYFLGKLDNSLATSWDTCTGERLWLNPPFGRIEPWARKCSEWLTLECGKGAKLLFLAPASIGSNWFANYVHGKALVLALSPRLTFVGCTTPYPKDCILSVYGETPGFETWRWK